MFNIYKLEDFAIEELHSKIPKDKILEILTKIQSNNKKRTIILSTPIAESSLTIKNVEVVIDSGKFFSKIFLTGNTFFITNSMKEQRKGRVGRVQEGKYIRLYDNKKLLKDYRKIDFQYLFPYIITCLYYGINYKKDLFILPINISRFDKTLNYFQYKGIDIEKNIKNIFNIMLRNQCNLYEYVNIYLSNNKRDIKLLTFFDNNDDDITNLQEFKTFCDLIIEKLKCNLVSYYSKDDRYLLTLSLYDDYDRYKDINNEFLVQVNQSTFEKIKKNKKPKIFLVYPDNVIVK